MTGNIHGFGKSLEKSLDDVMRLIAVKEFDVEIATRLIRKGLEKFPRESETKSSGRVLIFFREGKSFVSGIVESAPNQVWPAAEINDATREAFVHRNVGFAGERIFRMKARAVAADSFFVAQRLCKRLAQRNAAIFDGVMRVHFQITDGFESQINDSVFREQCQHVIEERDSSLDGRLARAVNVEADFDARLLCDAFDF